MVKLWKSIISKYIDLIKDNYAEVVVDIRATEGNISAFPTGGRSSSLASKTY